MSFFCYLLECSDGSYYTGWSLDPEKRTSIHNTGRGARYTRMHRPVRLVYKEELPDRSSAQKREHAIKRMSHEQKQLMIAKSSMAPEEDPQ
ncbi:MAG: GIY-YIG nuclease family protein [Anaerolineaceae bacterium]